jgi:hypothetical protein
MIDESICTSQIGKNDKKTSGHCTLQYVLARWAVEEEKRTCYVGEKVSLYATMFVPGATSVIVEAGQ